MAPEALEHPEGRSRPEVTEMQPESTTVAPRGRRTRQQIAADEAYAAFDASHRHRLEAFCMVDLRNWEEARELAADALIELWKHWFGLRSHDERALRAYVVQDRSPKGAVRGAQATPTAPAVRATRLGHGRHGQRSGHDRPCQPRRQPVSG